jgi:hypothetical protein
VKRLYYSEISGLKSTFSFTGKVSRRGEHTWRKWILMAGLKTESNKQEMNMKNHFIWSLLFLLTACSTPVTRNDAGIRFKEQEHDFGSLGYKKAVEYQFEFSNPGLNRFYPKYLLIKLYNESKQKKKAVTTVKELLGKQVKIESTAIEEVRVEMEEILLKHQNSIIKEGNNTMSHPGFRLQKW